MDFQYDHSNIESLRFLFSTYSKKAIETMKTLAICDQDIQRFPGFYTWAIFRSVEELDMHGCKLEQLPSNTLTRAMPLLSKLNLSRNRFSTVKDIVPFGSLHSLVELNIKENPIPFITHRITLVQSLLFPADKIRYKFLRYLTGEYHQDTGVKSAQNSPSKNRTKSYTGIRQFLKLKRKPAKVPRNGVFPMLSILNEQPITEDEVVSAKPYNDKDVILTVVNTPVHMRSVTNTPSIFKDQRVRKSSHPCVIRKEKVEPVPRFIKIPEFVGDAVLRSTVAVVRGEVVDPKNRSRIHEANHRERDIGTNIKRKVKPVKLRRFAFKQTGDPNDSYAPSVAAEEDTVRSGYSKDEESESEKETVIPPIPRKSRTDSNEFRKMNSKMLRSATMNQMRI